MTTNIKWPKYRATVEPHTVEVRGARLAGFLVRDAGSRSELGYIWSKGAVWGWRAADGQHYGERATQAAAIEVLRDTFDCLRAAQTKTTAPAKTTARPMPASWLPFADDDRYCTCDDPVIWSGTCRTCGRDIEPYSVPDDDPQPVAPKTAPKPVAPPVVVIPQGQHIKWGTDDGGDLRADVARAFDKLKGSK